MKRILYIFLAGLLLLAGFTSCADEAMMQSNGGSTANGDIHLKVTAHIPAPKQVITRDIDPDGLGVNSLWLFCFNDFGEYIGRREVVNFENAGGGKYSFEVDVPSSTNVIHFLSNVYLDEFNDRDNFGRNETTVIPSFVSASGRMSYWGRSDLATLQSRGNVELYRNQAQVHWDTDLPQGMTIYGYGICNRRAWGTLAPFNTEAGQNQAFDFDLDNPYVTEPAEEYQILASDPTEATVQGDESEGDPHYIFENPNTLDAPVFAVMKISINGQDERNAKYYKIMFVDDEKNQLEIYRNYEYVISITGLPTSMGYDTFEEAKNGVAANNAWVSVDPEIPELTDGINTVRIENGTTQVFNEGGNQVIAFTYDGNADDISVEWLEDGRNVSNTNPTITLDGNGSYSINLNLNEPTDDPQMGTLLLHTGVFTRQIKVYLVNPFSFQPVWVSTGVPMVKEEKMSMTFVIPDNYPAELFPIECKIATNKMNANDDLGIQLPIIMEKCEYDVTDDNGQQVHVTSDLGYKYVYTATEPGVQEIFFTLNTSDGEDFGVTWDGGACPNNGTNHGHVFLEADYFNDAHRLVKFQEAGENISNRRITIEGSANDNPGFLLQELAPTANQPISVTLNFMADEESWGQTNTTPTAPESGTLMRIATAVAEPADRSIYLSPDECASLGLPTSNNIVNYYYYRFDGNTKTLELGFVTNTSDIEDIIRFSIDQENGMNHNLDEQYLYKSAGVELRANPARFDFGNFTVDDDNPNAEGVKYGLNQPIHVSFTLPQASVQYNDATFFISTQNLIPAADNTYTLTETEGGYNFTVPQQTANTDINIMLNFLTNRIANGETLTIDAVDNTALFNPASATFTNTPIRGTITLGGDNPPQLTTSSFITLERKNGTRVGIITVESVTNNVANYRIDLRSEYDFTMDEELTIYYNSLDTQNQRIYQETTTFQTLVNDATDDGMVTLITLRER